MGCKTPRNSKIGQWLAKDLPVLRRILTGKTNKWDIVQKIMFDCQRVFQPREKPSVPQWRGTTTSLIIAQRIWLKILVFTAMVGLVFTDVQPPRFRWKKTQFFEFVWRFRKQQLQCLCMFFHVVPWFFHVFPMRNDNFVVLLPPWPQPFPPSVSTESAPRMKHYWR